MVKTKRTKTKRVTAKRQRPTLATCPRCGKRHEELRIRPLKSTMRINERAVSSWALCPLTNEPILLFAPEKSLLDIIQEDAIAEIVKAEDRKVLEMLGGEDSQKAHLVDALQTWLKNLNRGAHSLTFEVVLEVSRARDFLPPKFAVRVVEGKRVEYREVLP